MYPSQIFTSPTSVSNRNPKELLGQSRELKVRGLYLADESSWDGEPGHAGPSQLDDHLNPDVG